MYEDGNLSGSREEFTIATLSLTPSNVILNPWKDMLQFIVSELSGRRDALANLPLMLISDTQIMLLSITQAGDASRTIRQLKQ